MPHTNFGKDWTILEEVIGDLARALRRTDGQTNRRTPLFVKLRCSCDATKNTSNVLCPMEMWNTAFPCLVTRRLAGSRVAVVRSRSPWRGHGRRGKVTVAMARSRSPWRGHGRRGEVRVAVARSQSPGESSACVSLPFPAAYRRVCMMGL